jgi:hypothetical protein
MRPDELGRRIRHRQIPPETPEELCDALVHEWKNITQAFIQGLVHYQDIHKHISNAPESKWLS